MVRRVFFTLNLRPRLLKVPLSVFRMVLACMRLLPRYSNWSAAMTERINPDLVFGHVDAVRNLNFAPRSFRLIAADIESQRPAAVAADHNDDPCL